MNTLHRANGTRFPSFGIVVFVVKITVMAMMMMMASLSSLFFGDDNGSIHHVSSPRSFIVSLLPTLLALFVLVLLPLMFVWQYRLRHRRIVEMKTRLQHEYERENTKMTLNESSSSSLLKNGFATRKLASHYDAIVIGSGIGGLSTASLLAQQSYVRMR